MGRGDGTSERAGHYTPEFAQAFLEGIDQQWELERAASEGATLGGALIDLAEQQRPVTIRTHDGHRVSGPIVAVGADFGVVRGARLGDAIIPTSRIAMLRPSPGEGLPDQTDELGDFWGAGRV